MAACSIQATLASILQRLRIVEENQSRSNAAIAKMRLEMEDASSRIQELEFSHESALREINSLLQRFGEQMTTLRRKEQEKLWSAFLRLREEIEEERNSCRLLKLENKKLMKDLEEANNVAADTGEELDRERQARELMEEVCNELAREIGEDKAEVEQLKQEQAKSREIVEGELKMMRMASLWQDEGMRTGAPLELEDQHQVAVPLQELKSKIEEFVSTVSEGCEPYKDPMHAEYIEEKQRKVIEQAKMLRQALELSMQQQLVDEGSLAQAQSDFDFKEEKILTPISQDQHIHNCGSKAGSLTATASKIHEYKEQSMRLLELQAKPGHYMLSYSKKPCKDIRRPRSMTGDDHDYPAANAHSHGRNHFLRHDYDAETQPESGSGKYSVENDCIQARLHQSPSPEQLMYESSKIWLASEKQRKDYGLPGDRNEPQIDESRMLQRSLSSSRTPPKAGLHRKQLSLHLDANRQFLGENADVWEVRVPPNIQVKSYSKNDASHICTDEARQVTTNRSRPSNNCICSSHHADDMHPWKSPGQEEMPDDGDISHHAECLMRHEYEEAKSLCVGRAEGEEHGEFDGFYFEPVMDVDAIEAHSLHYVHGEDVDDRVSMADDAESSYSNVYRAAQQSKSPKELTKSFVHDAHSHKSARYSGASAAKASGRDEAPHKLVVPTPSIRVPLVKAQLTPPPKSARSISPSKPQVLQCFRPPPTSPEHHFAASSAIPLFGKSRAKAPIEVPQLVMEPQNGGNSSVYTSKATLLKAPSYNKAYTMIGQESAHQRSSGDGEASTSTMLEDKKGNSLRAELLKARELDLQQYVEHVHYNMQKHAAAASAAPPPPPPVKNSASSSFRFSPLRKSLTSASHGSR